MNFIPMTLYRPTQASDGQGGLVPTYSTSAAIYGSVELFKEMLVMIVDRCEDVKVEDVIVCRDEMDLLDAWYRVVTMLQPPRGRNRMVTIERIEKPLWPLNLKYLFYNGEQLFFNGQPLYVE